VIDLPNMNPEDEVIVEVIEHEAPLTERSLARRTALQVLYELDCTNHNPEEVITARLMAQELQGKPARFVRQLVKGVLTNQEPMDQVIRKYATEWPLDQVAIIDRNILRMAIYELTNVPSTPTGAVVDEAVSLAKLFGADNSMAFVNGVLGKLAADKEALQKMLVDAGEAAE
jgi:transcription antitermination protein NusB